MTPGCAYDKVWEYLTWGRVMYAQFGIWQRHGGF